MIEVDSGDSVTGCTPGLQTSRAGALRLSFRNSRKVLSPGDPLLLVLRGIRQQAGGKTCETCLSVCLRCCSVRGACTHQPAPGTLQPDRFSVHHTIPPVSAASPQPPLHAGLCCSWQLCQDCKLAFPYHNMHSTHTLEIKKAEGKHRLAAC